MKNKCVFFIKCAVVSLILLSVKVFGTPASPIYVDAMATAGNGTSSSPWTGWDTAITWTPNTLYTFRSGWYSYSGTPSGWSQSYMLFKGEPGTVLKCSSCTGPVVSIIKPSASTYGLMHIRFENFLLDGGGSATKGLYLERVSRSAFDNVRVQNTTQIGFHLNFNVLNTFTNPKVTDANSPGLVSMPAISMQIDNYSSANTIINPVFEGNEIYPSVTPSNAVGFKFSGVAVQNVIVGGTVEGLMNGIVLGSDTSDTDCSKNTFNGIDLEGNSGNDIIIDAGRSNQFNNVIALSAPAGDKNVKLFNRSRANQFIGGNYSSIYERGQYNSFFNIELSAYDSTHFDSHLISAALINVRESNPSSVKSYSRLPANTVVGQFGNELKNIYSYTTNNISPAAPSSIPGTVKTSIWIDSNITQDISKGASVSVGYVDGAIPDNYFLSGYVDPSSPQQVVIRWTQISGTPVAPPAGKYKITVMQ